jgi:hypothetical protein
MEVVGFVSPMKIHMSLIRTTKNQAGFFSSQHTKFIRWDNGEVGIIEDTRDGDGFADACEGGSRLDPRS